MSSSRGEITQDEVKMIVRGLLQQANTYSLTHLSDPTIQHEFREQYRFLGKCLLRDYENGILVGERVVRLVKRERQSLIDQARELAVYGIGLVAGIGQLSVGYGGCVTSSIFSIAGASWCSTVGMPMMVHGGNNIYENSHNMTGNIIQNWKGEYTGKYGNSNSLLRKQYHKAASSLGLSKRDGDAAYAVVDLATSLYGLVSKKRVVQKWTNMPDSEQLMLFRYFKRDYAKGWRSMSKGALGFEFGANTVTAASAISPYFEGDE
ncbi:DUF4225 domain-containing protein [Vibrio neptunius]|uniref:DUF4225 domain-containing protein n=1 Tax=Vibrio neptunius TaxID=170651 RepID=UPI0019D1752A|nr:DUF4225 domain-containing protein [Vibrio neptunius]MBN3573701.1 DUF4225 domain-containing protein [Vibrio neptunius]